MEWRVVLNESFCPHEYDRPELCKSYKAEVELLKAWLDVLVIEYLPVDPNYRGVVNEIQQQKVVENSFAYLENWLFDNRGGRSLANNRMDSYPREYFHDIVKSVVNGKPAAF